MKKTILSMLMGATMLASAANAAPSMKIDATDLVLPTGDQVISDLYIQNTGGINNVSLSKYEQAWMIVHEKDTAFKHKTFWVRTGKVFTGVSIDDIKDLSKSDRSDFIKNEVVSNLVIAELNKQIADLEIATKEAIEKLSKEFSQANAKIVADFQAEIAELNEAHAAIVAAKDIEIAEVSYERDVYKSWNNDYADWVSDLQAEIVTKDAEISRLTGELSTAQALLAEANAAVISANDRYGAEAQAHINTSLRLGIQIENITADLNAANAKVAELEAELATAVTDALFVGNVTVDGVRIGNGGIAASLGYTGPADIASLVSYVEEIGYNVETVAYSLVDAGLYGNVELATAAILDGSAEFAIGNALIQSYIDGQMSVDITSDNAQAIADAKARGLASFEAKTKEGSKDVTVSFINHFNPMGQFVHSYDITVDGKVYTVSAPSIGNLVSQLENTAAAAFEAGYEAGYSDGYNDGYADGYADGFADGVASVK